MEENSSFGFLAVGFCELAKNQMCCLCGGFHNEAQRAAYWRWAGVLPLTLKRRTKVEFCTFVDTKHVSTPIANTMLGTVILTYSCIISTSSIISSCCIIGC